MNSPKRKATAKQLSALKKAREALQAKYGTTNISEIRTMNTNPTKRKGKKSKKSKASAAPKKRKGGKRKARRTAAQKAATKRMIAANKKPGKKGRRKGKKRSSAPRAAGRSSKSSRSSSRSRSTSRSSTIREKVKVVKVPQGGVLVASAAPRKRRRSRNPVTSIDRAQQLDRGFDLTANPVDTGLFGNAGPFTGEKMKEYGVAIGGVAAGFLIADFLDRFVATMTPDGGKYAWMGNSAAAAQRRRPGAMRLGVQALLAVGAMAGAYWTRNGRFLTWLLAGTAVGAGAKLLESLFNWYLMPAIFSVSDPKEVSFSNRMYPMEQGKLQDAIDKIFDQYTTFPSLAEGQADPPVIHSPLTMDPRDLVARAGTPVYSLGGANPSGKGRSDAAPTASQRPGSVGATFVPTGRLGRCDDCGGTGGCWSSCPDFTCTECQGPKNGEIECEVTVGATDDLAEIVRASGADIEAVNRLNNGTMEEYWQVGNTVTLPWVICRYLQNQDPDRLPQGALASPPPEASPLPEAHPAVAGLSGPGTMGASPEAAPAEPAAPEAPAAPPNGGPPPSPTIHWGVVPDALEEQDAQ